MGNRCRPGERRHGGGVRRLALEGDSVSAYGGVIGANRMIDEATAARAIRARLLRGDRGAASEALEILRTKRGFEIIEVPPTDSDSDEIGIGRFDFKRIGGGLSRTSTTWRRTATSSRPSPSAVRPWRSDRSALRLARGPPREVECGRPGQEARHGRHGGRTCHVLCRWRWRWASACRCSPSWPPTPTSRSPMASRLHHPTRRQHPGRDGHRGRGPAPHGGRAPAAVTSSTEPMTKAAPVKQPLRVEKHRSFLEAIRATEAGAIAAARGPWRPLMAIKAPAVTAMRKARRRRHQRHHRHRPRGERDEAPMLYIGEQVGNADAATSVDIAVSDPLEGKDLVALPSGERHRRPRPRGRGHARPDTYLEKLIVGPSVAGHVRPPGRSDARHHPERLGHKIWDITVVILERERHEKLIADVRRGGGAHQAHRRRDLTAAISASSSAAPVCMPSWASAARRGRRPRGARSCPRRDPGPLPWCRRGERAGPGDGCRCRRRRARLTSPMTWRPARTWSSAPPA